MRNRFRPNVTPRGSRTVTRSSPSTSTPVSQQHAVQTIPSSTAASENSETSTGDTTNNEQVHSLNGSNSVQANEEGSDATESDSSLLQKTLQTSNTDNTNKETNVLKGTPCVGRRSRIRPSVVPVARSRANANLTQARKSKNEQEKTNQVSASSSGEETIIGLSPQTQDQLSSTGSSSTPSSPAVIQQSSTASHAESTDTVESTTSSEQHEQPVATSGQIEADLVSHKKSSSTSGPLLTRRKRALPNLGSVSRRKRSTSTSKDGPSKETSVQQVNSEESLPVENTESINVSDDALQVGGKRARTVSESENIEEPAMNVEPVQQQTSEEAQSQQDSEEVSVKKVTRKRRGNSRLLKVRDTNPATMIMQQLIYYNPKTNPMSSSVESKKNKTMEITSSNNSPSNRTRRPENDKNRSSTEETVNADGCVDVSVNGETESEPSAPAPQVKLAADGTIILDEESLVVQTAPNTTIQDSEVVYEDAADGSYNHYLRHRRVERWSMEETLKFYKALSQVGTDFSLMLPLFPTRKRKELKAKFKREEKFHRDLVEKALRHRTPIDVELYAPQVEGEEIDDPLDEQQ